MTTTKQTTRTMTTGDLSELSLDDLRQIAIALRQRAEFTQSRRALLQRTKGNVRANPDVLENLDAIAAHCFALRDRIEAFTAQSEDLMGELRKRTSQGSPENGNSNLRSRVGSAGRRAAAIARQSHL